MALRGRNGDHVRSWLHTRALHRVCRTEALVTCPECGGADLALRYSEAVEPHGERHWDEYWICVLCGEKFAEEDLERESHSANRTRER